MLKKEHDISVFYKALSGLVPVSDENSWLTFDTPTKAFVTAIGAGPWKSES